MLTKINWTTEPVPVYYRFGLVGFEEGGGQCDAKCDFVRIRCGEDSRVAVGLALTFKYDVPEGGMLDVLATDVPDALRAALASIARGAAVALPDAVFVGERRGCAGLDLSGLEVFAAAHAEAGTVSFKVGPVKRSDFEALILDQSEEQTAARAWAASG